MPQSRSRLDPAGFAPDGERARRLDARMRERLVESLRHVLERSAGRLPAPAGFDAFLERAASAPVQPQAFGAYFDLVVAIEAGRLGEAASLLAEMVELAPPGPTTGRVELRDVHTDRFGERYRRLIDTDPATRFEMRPPRPEAARRCRARVDEALGWMRAADPDLHAEFTALVRELVLAAGPDRPGARTFDGASSLLLWGGVVLNADPPRTVLETLQVLAHESTHVLLFGLAADDPLLLNEPAERHASPLRDDPRPLDGIVHATFVVARVHRATRRLLDADLPAREERARAEASLAEQRSLFRDGMRTLDRHARLTPLGRALLEGAREHLESTADEVAITPRSGCRRDPRPRRPRRRTLP